MNISEGLTRTLLVIAPLSRLAIVTVAATLALCAVLLPLCRRTWLNKSSFSWLGIFYRQGYAGYVKLACAWVKLVLLFTLLAGYKALDASEYAAFLIPGLVYAALSRSFAVFANKLLWLALETAGLLACNTLCDFVIEMDPGAAFMAVYVALSVFIAIFGFYLFLRELHSISGERRRFVG
jgi:hypothetical protein